jgi:hypothetical protein
MLEVVCAVGFHICETVLLDSAVRSTWGKGGILCGGVNCYIGGNVLGCNSAAYLYVWFRKLGGSGVQWVGSIEAGNCLLVHT